RGNVVARDHRLRGLAQGHTEDLTVLPLREDHARVVAEDLSDLDAGRELRDLDRSRTRRGGASVGKELAIQRRDGARVRRPVDRVALDRDGDGARLIARID